MKRYASRMAMMVTAAMTLVACQVTPDNIGYTDENSSGRLSDTSWHVKSIDGDDIVFNAMITMAFEENQVSGVAGCNNYFGSINIIKQSQFC